MVPATIRTGRFRCWPAPGSGNVPPMATRRPPERRRPPVVDEDLPPLRPDEAPRDEGAPPARPRRPWLRRILIGGGALAFGFLSGYALRDAGPQISTTGPPQDAHLGARATDDLLFRITSD